ISALARSWPAFLHDWHRVARADCVTLVHGAVCNPHAWRNAWLALRGGSRNPGQGNSGGQDESDETHGGTSLWVGLLRPERRSIRISPAPTIVTYVTQTDLFPLPSSSPP